MYRRLLYLMLVFVFVSSACSLFGPGTTVVVTATPEPSKPTVAVAEATPTEKSTQPEPEATATAEEAPVAEGLVTSLEDVKKATIQVVTQGTYIEPDFSVQYNSGSLGSGFIIDPEGIAITNNHVATGAASITVYIGGDTQTPKHAKVLGVSECSDLAVIDIDGSGYPYLEWSEETPKVGMKVFATGFPKGDPEYTLTDGVVSKAKAGGDTNWTSVEGVIEHTALIKPGNSGGPLVNENGQIIGVNFGGFETGPYYAITKTEVDSSIEELRAGKDVNSLGLNGLAFYNQENGLAGIWVYSVKSGSPADKAGIRGGDIVTSLEDIILSTQGTMKEYCDILRSHNAGDTLNVTVLRFADMTYLTGQINGRELAIAQSFATELQEEVDNTSTDNSNYSGYVSVTDDTGAITVEIPAEWAEISGGIWETTWDPYDVSAPAINASADLNLYNNSYDESGIFFAASSDLGKVGGFVQLLDGTRDWYKNDCKADGASQSYDDGVYEGRFQIWKQCGPNRTTTFVLAARPKVNPTSFLVLLEMKLTRDADVNVLQHILETFVVVGDV